MKNGRPTTSELLRCSTVIAAMTLIALYCTCDCQAVDVPQLPIDSYRLPNGLKVALSADPTAPRTTVCVTYHVGSKDERTGLTGFAHFFEHMMFRGTRNVPNFDKPLQQAGGSPNAFTSTDVTVYFETVPSNYLQRTLYMEAERMAFLDSALDLNKFDTEREIVKNERRQRMENVPYGLAVETIAGNLFPQGHPYSWSVIGSMKDLNSATLTDLREFFLEFYHPANATLAVVGSFDVDSAKNWIEHYFGALRSGPHVDPVHAEESPSVSKSIVQRDQVQFPRVYWSWPSVPVTHEDAAALELLATILSDGDASRLRRALIIDQTWATDVTAHSRTQEIAGLFMLDAVVAPGKQTGDVERILARELNRVRSVAPSEAEVTRALRKYQKATLSSLTNTTGRAFAIAMGLAQFDNPNHFQDEYRNRARVTPGDIRRVAQRYLTAEKLVLHVVPAGEGQSESPAVLAGPLADNAARPQVEARTPASGIAWAELPKSGPEKDFVPPSFESHQLSNGMQVWIAGWRTLPLVSVQLVVPTGSVDAAKRKAGLASLTAKLWEKGTQSLTSTEFAAALDALGTSLAITAGPDSTELSFTVVKDSLDEAMSQVGSLVSQPRFDQTDFQREQALLISELARGPDSPQWIARRVLPGLMYGTDHPYGVPVSGYKPTVQNLTREDVQEFYSNHFRPSDSTLIIVGDVDAKPLIDHLEASWGTWRRDVSAAARVTAAPRTARRAVYVVDKPGAVQSVVLVGRLWRGRNDSSFFATRIGNRVLGGDFLSRLNQNLRETNGYTYGANSSFRYRQQTSEWVLGTSVRANVTGAALEEIVSELAAVGKDRPLTDSEIEIARNAELNTFPAQFESPAKIASSLSDLVKYQLPKDYLQQVARQLRAVDGKRCSELLAELAESDELTTLVVGDRSVIEAQLTESGFERIMYLDADGNQLD